MRTVTFSEARSRLKDILDAVVDDHAATLIKRRDADDVVVMSLADYNSLQETMYLLSTPANARQLMDSIAQLNTGKARPRQLIDPVPD